MVTVRSSFKILLSFLIVLQLAVAPIAQSAESKPAAFFDPVSLGTNSAPSIYVSDQERLDIRKLKQYGIETTDAELLVKIEQAKNVANTKAKNDPLYKKLNENGAKNNADKEKFANDHLIKLREFSQAETTLKASAQKFISDRNGEVEKTKKKQSDLNDLKNLNNSLQQNLDNELDLILSPEERVQIGDVEADYLFSLEENYPNDTEVNNQWEIGSILSQFETHFDAPASTTKRIIVAIIDSGVDYTHEDLVGHFYNPATCFDETGTTTPSGCPYGGWDYVDDDNDPMPILGETHGTKVAGLIGAQSGSNLGIASLSNNLIDLMPIRVTDGGYIELSKIIDAIYFAVENGADVINMSFTGPTYSSTLEDAIGYAEQNGVIVVTASGNYGMDIDNTPMYPASYDLDNIITVGALNVDHTLASFSNYGDQTVDFATPGVDLITTNVGNSYTVVNGTSFSAGIASAMVGALLAQGEDPLAVFATLDESPTLAQQTINGHVLGAAVDLPPTEPIQINFYATATDPVYGDYYVNTKGGVSTASTTYQLSYSNPNPYLKKPVLYSPGNTSSYQTLYGDSFLFGWNPVPGATFYGLYIRDMTTGQLIYDKDFLTTNTTHIVSGIFTPGHDYRWNTRAFDSLGDYGQFSDQRYFKIATSPAIPTTNQPGSFSAPGTAYSGTSLQFTWNTSNGADYYELNILDRDTSTFLVEDYVVTDTSKTINTLADGHEYKWDVRACYNSGGCSGYSQDRYFVIGSINTAPNMPAMYGGAVSATKNVSYGVTLVQEWEADGDSVRFYVDWGDGVTSNTSSYFAVNDSEAMSHTYTTNGTYCIKARSYDGEDYSNWSSCKNVTVSDAVTGADLIGRLDTNDDYLSASDYTTVDFEIENAGNTTVTNDFKVDFYLSRDPYISASTDQWLGSYDITNNINASGILSGSKNFPLPDAGHSSYYGDGKYYIGLVVDPQNSVAEGSETNNIGRGLGVDIRSLQINGTQSGKLVFDITYSGTSTVGVPFNITITPNQSGYTGQVRLSALLGSVSPEVINVNGVTTQSITLNGDPGYTNITVSNEEGLGASKTFYLGGSGVNVGKSIVKVTDKLENPVAGAKVQLICGLQSSTCPSTAGSNYTQTSNNLGEVVFTNIEAGSYTVQVDFNNFVDDSNNLVIVSNFLTNKYINVKIPTDINLTPIVFIPGIVGSTDKNDFAQVPILSSGSYANHSEDLKIVDVPLLPSFAGGNLGWKKMIKAFEKEYGYRNGSSIIECPWDWREKSDDAARIYLKRCIDTAKRLTGKSKVDIVAHSMGGLVARAYIQDGGYQDDVRKVAFMGTPHQGATNAYLLWGGKIPALVHRLVLARLIKEENFESESLVGNLFDSVLSTYLTAERKTVKDFVRGYVPSIEHLLPTYNFLVYDRGGNFGPHPLIDSENSFLKGLNNETCIHGNCPSYNSSQSKFGTGSGKVEARVFYNSGVGTNDIVTVNRNSTDFNEDGDITKITQSEGDETVPEDSAFWLSEDDGGANIEGIQLVDVSDSTKHASLPYSFVKQVAEYITGQAFTTSSFELEALVDDAPTLTLELEGQHQPLLTTPSGKSVGITANSSTTEEANGIKFFEVGADSSSITLSSPVSGEYTLTLQGGLEAGDYGFYLDYNSPDVNKVVMTDSMYDGSTTTFTFILAPNAEEVISFDKIDSVPGNIIAENNNNLTKLSWTVPSSTPTAYNIYSKMAYDSTMEYQTQVSTTTYTTSDVWAGASTTLMKRYQVSAIYANGEESFLSNAVYNNDEDQDGLPDHLEVEEGTSTSTPDTDSDGLKDGEEYFNYGTDPTLSDTDGDGINDYDEVTPGGTGSTTPAVASQVYLDSLENGWAEYGSYGTVVDYGASTEVAQGSKAIKIATDGTWKGMWLRNNNSFDTTQYNSLKFAYHPGNLTNHISRIRFYDENHEPVFSDYVNISNYITEDISGGIESKWYNVAIPLVDLGIVNETVGDMLVITSNTATFYLDNIHFSSETVENNNDTVLYNNALQNGWQESGSWSVGTNFSENNVTFASSSASIALTYNTAWAGMALTTSNIIDGSIHNNMHLAYNPGSTGGQTDYIKLRNASSTDLTANYISLSNYISGSPQANTWYPLTIPLVDLGASTSTIKDLIVTGSASTTIYLDDLRFTTPTSSASSSLSQSAVFLEGLVSPWQDGGDWRVTTNFNSDVAKTGAVGLEVAYDDPWSGNVLAASTSIDTTDFNTLHLAYNSGSTTSQTLYVKLRDDQSADYSSYISFSNYISGSPQANTWYELSLPFTDLGVTPGDLVKDIIFTTSGTSTIYLDDIYFVASSTTSGTTTNPNNTNVSIYTDMFQNNWTHGGSWLATTTYTSATHTTGSYGIETEFTDGQWSDSAFETNAFVDTTNLSSLSLSYNPGATTSHVVYVKTKDETGTDHGSAVSLNNYITNMVANTWHNLTIPLIDLGISVGELVKNIIFISQDGPKVYFDDVYFGEPNTGGSDTFSEGMVSFSFDDGWLDHYTEALPILDAKGIDGTFYIVSEETIQATDLPQLVPNLSLESGATLPDDWSFGTWGDNDATSTYPVTGIDGADAARIEMTNYTDGDAKWYFDDVTVYPDNKYTTSYQYRSNVATDFVVRYTMQDDSYQYVTVATNSTSTSWASTTVTITTPANVKSLTIFPSLTSVGYLEVDNFSVIRKQVFVDPNQVLAIEASGHEIGSHTRHHTALTQVNSTTQADEIETSRADLLNTSKIGVANVTSLAYPYGDYNTTVQSLIQSAGYSNARSTDLGFNYPNTNKYALKLQQVDRNTTLSEIQNWIQTAKQDKTWLILMFHQIDDVSAHSLGITSELLEDIAEYVASDGITTVTVSDGVGLME